MTAASYIFPDALTISSSASSNETASRYDRFTVSASRHGKDPGPVRNDVALEALGITRTVEVFMMSTDDLGGTGKVADMADDPETDLRVSAHDDLFLGSQRPRLVEHRVRHADLADVMEQGAAVEVHKLPPANLARVCNDEGILGHPEGMVADLVLPRVDGVHEGLERHEVGRIDMVDNAFEIGVAEVAVLAAVGAVRPPDVPVLFDRSSAVGAGMDVFPFGHVFKVSAAASFVNGKSARFCKPGPLRL